MTDADRRLRALLSAPERGIDEAFAQRVRQSVLLEQRVRAARLLAWKRFAGELAASGAVLLALLALVGIVPLGPSLAASASPSAIGLLIVSIWVAVTLTPASRAGA